MREYRIYDDRQPLPGTSSRYLVSEKIYIASALALCSHALVIGLAHTLLPEHTPPEPEMTTTIMLVDIDTSEPPPLTANLANVPPPPAKNTELMKETVTTQRPTPTRSRSSSRVSPRVSTSLVTAENPIAEKSAAEPDNTIIGSAQTTEYAKPTPGGLSMRGHGVGPIDVRGRGQLAAAVAASDIPGTQARQDLLHTPSSPTIGKEPTWSPSGNGTFQADKEPFKAKITRDGRIHFRNKRNVQLEGIGLDAKTKMPVLKGRFDLTDAVMASFGEVLYPYRKLKLMDESREARAEMAQAYESEVLKAALFGYRKRLSELWKAPRYSLAERKRLLFLLWDECAEAGPTSIVTTARAIRATTLHFIRKKLPPEHPQAYSDKELQLLNAKRQSTKRFRPYGP